MNSSSPVVVCALPRWREVRQIQHPCSDGDYVWRDDVRGDTVWWWGGVNERVNHYWQHDEPRKDGVIMGDACLAIAAADHRVITGRLFNDESALREVAGVTDFSKYPVY